jgi:DNA polymerase (family X)
LREDRGEIEASEKSRLPNLVALGDIRGDLHLHTNKTDGRNSLEEMIAAAAARGYSYAAITDHSGLLSMSRDAGQITAQIEEIDHLNKSLKKFTVLKGIELEILEDGKLDVPDSILKEFDLTVCTVRSKLNLPVKKQTERIIRAMNNPYCTILVHPTGRIINGRKGYEVDMERLMKAARESGCILEVSGRPAHLDLPADQCRMAKEMGVKLAISTEAHAIDELADIQFGVDQARRGWLEAGDIVNTRDLKGLRKLLKRSR